MSDNRFKPEMTEITGVLSELKCPVHNVNPKLILTDSNLSIENPCCDEFQVLIQNELKHELKKQMSSKTKDAIMESFKDVFRN